METKIKAFSELNIEELYDILKVRSEVFVVEQECIYLDCDGKDRAGFHVFIYNEENEVAAYTRILNRGVSYDEVSIGRVLVNPKDRGTGLGNRIMRESIEYIFTEMRETEIRISAQKYLQNFYESLGFIKISDVYLEDGIEHLEMLLRK